MQSLIIRKLRKHPASFALSNLALTLIVTVGYRFHLNTAIVGMICLLVIVLHAVAVGFVSSAIVSIVAGACLVYFFAYPIFDFRIDDPVDAVALLVFLVVSNVLAWFASKAYETILDSRRKLTLVESAAQIAVWNRDPRTNVITFSSEYNKLYGLAAGQQVITYDEWLGVIHPEDREQVRVHNSDALTQTHILDEEFRVVWPDGSVHWLLGKGTVFADEIGRPGRIAGVNIDITERKHIEEALRRSEARWNAAIENVGAGIVIATETEQVIYRNPAARAMHGFTSDQVGIGSLQEMTRIFELWTLDGRLLTLDEWPFRRIKRGETLKDLELRLCRLDQGWEKIVSYSGAILESTINERLLFLSVQDLTDQRRAEQSLRESEERLRLLGDDLAASRDEIRALAASLMRAQEDERRRVSRDLHDHICHQLGYLASDLGNLAVSPLAPENLRAHLTAIRARVVKTSQETHDIAYQMHTAILKDLGLVASLKALCRQLSDQYPNIVVDFKNSGPPTSIPSEAATCLYRIAQEGLQNVVKHSGAKNLSLRLGFKKGAIVLTIQDDGAGFDSKAVKGHGGIGLISMKERAHSVNGELTINSQPSHGTQITLEIPLQVGN